MRIFSKFHDYYDKVLMHGIDPTIVYSRKTESYKWEVIEQQIKKYVPFILEKFDELYLTPHWADSDIKIENIIAILFCGKVYLCIELVTGQKSYTDVTDFFFNANSIEKLYQKKKVKIPEEKKGIRYRGSLTNKSLKRFFNFYPTEIRKDVVDLHFELDSPIILIKKEQYQGFGAELVTINPCLKDLKFYKCVDAFTAFQELSMFISGVMGGKVPKMVEISDQDRIAKHGFNQWSFRKEPSKKKR